MTPLAPLHARTRPRLVSLLGLSALLWSATASPVRAQIRNIPGPTTEDLWNGIRYLSPFHESRGQRADRERRERAAAQRRWEAAEAIRARDFEATHGIPYHDRIWGHNPSTREEWDQANTYRGLRVQSRRLGDLERWTTGTGTRRNDEYVGLSDDEWRAARPDAFPWEDLESRFGITRDRAFDADAAVGRIDALQTDYVGAQNRYRRDHANSDRWILTEERRRRANALSAAAGFEPYTFIEDQSFVEFHDSQVGAVPGLDPLPAVSDPSSAGAGVFSGGVSDAPAGAREIFGGGGGVSEGGLVGQDSF